jgi:hypothetical protein
MSIKEKVLQKIETMTPSDLERLSAVLEQHDYPDVRVQRTPEQMAEIKMLLRELSAPMSAEQKTVFNEAMTPYSSSKHQ